MKQSTIDSIDRFMGICDDISEMQSALNGVAAFLRKERRDIMMAGEELPKTKVLYKGDWPDAYAYCKKRGMDRIMGFDIVFKEAK